MGGRQALLRADEPDETLQELESGLRSANTWFREANKNAILGILDDLTKRELEKGRFREQLKGSETMAKILSIVGPVFTQNPERLEHMDYIIKEVEERPTRVRNLILSSCEWILNRLEHGERLEYLADAYSTDVFTINKKWEEVAGTRRRPRYKVLDAYTIYRKAKDRSQDTSPNK